MSNPPRYTFITESDEIGMGRIVVSDFRQGVPVPHYYGIPLDVAISLAATSTRIAELEAEVEKWVDLWVDQEEELNKLKTS